MDDYKVVWSPVAKYSYIITLEYLEGNWPVSVFDSFVSRTDDVINYISQNPLLYPYSEHIDAYKCVVVKQVSLFYRLKDNVVELLVFWDNRQDSEKLLL